MGKISKLFKNEYIFAVIIKVFAIGIGLLQSIFIARFLGASLKGTSSYIGSVLSVCSIVFTFGMHQAYPYFKKRLGKDAFFNNYMTIIYFAFGGYLCLSILFFFCIPDISLDIRCAILLMPLSYLATCFQYVFLIDAPNKRNMGYFIISVIHLLLLMILYFFFEANYVLMLVLLCFDSILKVVFYGPNLKFKFDFSKRTLSFSKELLKFGFFPMLALLMTTLNYRIDVIMLKQYSMITTEMIGIYSLGISLSDKIVLLPDTLKGTLASKLASGKESEEVAKVARICFVSTLLMTLIIILLGRPFINLFYGSEYYDAYSIVVITAIGAISISFFKLIAQYNIIHKKQILNVIMLSIAIVVDVLGNMLLIPSMGIQGAAIATCLGNVICGIVFILFFSHKTGIHPIKMVFLQREDIASIKKILKKSKK